MTIITLTQYKGGVGKTTCAICLATLLQRTGETLLIDSDENKSASLWARKGKLPFRVCDDMEARKLLMSGDYEHVIIDTPARPSPEDLASLARGCDLLILPSSPDPLAIGALAQITNDLPDTAKFKCLITLSPPSPQRDGLDARDSLTRAGLPVFNTLIRRYKAYIKASTAGTVVTGNGWNDWEKLWKELQHDL